MLKTVTSFAEASKQFATRSILVSLVPICMIGIPLSLILAALSEPPLSLMFFCLAAGIVLFYLVSFALFAIFSPDRLQTEEHNFRNRAVSQITNNETLERVLIGASEPKSGNLLPPPAGRQEDDMKKGVTNG